MLSPVGGEAMRQSRGMTSAAPARVLVVAYRTAAPSRLLDEVRARARRSACSFTLLGRVPSGTPRPRRRRPCSSSPCTARSGGGWHAEGAVGDSDPFAALPFGAKAASIGGLAAAFESATPYAGCAEAIHPPNSTGVGHGGSPLERPSSVTPAAAGRALTPCSRRESAEEASRRFRVWIGSAGD
jgi:hypothetical protein